MSGANEARATSGAVAPGGCSTGTQPTEEPSHTARKNGTTTRTRPIHRQIGRRVTDRHTTWRELLSGRQPLSRRSDRVRRQAEEGVDVSVRHLRAPSLQACQRVWEDELGVTADDVIRLFGDEAVQAQNPTDEVGLVQAEVRLDRVAD